MMTNKREKLGKISSDLILKTPDSLDPIEIEKTLHKDYENNVFECINSSKKAFTGDFYVVVITKKERLMQNVIRHYFFSRASCPTPDYDQTVYKFNSENQEIELLWTIPSRDASFYLKDHSAEVVPSEWGLLDFVLKFADGTLFKMAKKLNNEMDDSPLLVQ